MKIESDILAKILMFKLNKIENSFRPEELQKINDITLDFEDIVYENDLFSFNMLKYFHNLESLTLRNFNLGEVEIDILLTLRDLKSLVLDKCSITNAGLFSHLKLEYLSISNCNIGIYNFLNEMNLKRLCLDKETYEKNKETLNYNYKNTKMDSFIILEGEYDE